MTWFFAIVVVLLMGAVAVVAAGLGGSMAETYDDRADARVQAEVPLTGDDLRRVRFTTAFRGYRMSEVDTLLARLAVELDAARPSAPPPAEQPDDHRAAAAEDRTAEQPAEPPAGRPAERAAEPGAVPSEDRGAHHRRGGEDG